MRAYFILFLSITSSLLISQVDTVLILGRLTPNIKESQSYIVELNKSCHSKLIEYELFVTYYRNIYLNIYDIEYFIAEYTYNDTTFSSASENRYILKMITKNDSIVCSYYTDPLHKKHYIKKAVMRY